MSKSTRNILFMSGCKNSTAQALCRRDRVSESKHCIAVLAPYFCRHGKLSLRED